MCNVSDTKLLSKGCGLLIAQAYICTILDSWYIRMKLTNYWITKLPANHTSICCVPWIITDCSPLPVVADFHSTLILISSSNETNITVGRACIITRNYEKKRNSCKSSNTHEYKRLYYLGTPLQHHMCVSNTSKMKVMNYSYSWESVSPFLHSTHLLGQQVHFLGHRNHNDDQ